MPEAPEVRRVVDKLRARVKGATLLWLEILPETKYTTSLTQWWGQVGHLFPSTCLEILCRGKQIFFFFENGLAFISGLGMEGHYYYFTSKTTAGHKALVGYQEEKNYAKFGLHFGKQTPMFLMSDTVVWYDDKLSYGNFTITNWQAVLDKMTKIGPDLLATTTPFREIHPVIRSILPPLFFEPASLELFATAIRSPRRDRIEVCRFLMEQEYFSGIGNYLKSEILYRARINPFRTLGTLTQDELVRLYGTCLTTIQQAYQAGGLTHGTFLDPDMQRGNFHVFVYKRAGQLDVHGHPVVFVSAQQSPDKRSTYYVPEVQPMV